MRRRAQVCVGMCGRTGEARTNSDSADCVVPILFQIQQIRPAEAFPQAVDSTQFTSTTAIFPSVSTWSPVAFWLEVGAFGRSTRAKPVTWPVKTRSLTTLARSRSICGSILWMKVRFSGENSIPRSCVAAQTHTGRPSKVSGRRQIRRWCRMAKVLFAF